MLNIFFPIYVKQSVTLGIKYQSIYTLTVGFIIFLAVWDWNKFIAFASSFTFMHISRNVLYVKVGDCLYLKKEKCISFIKCRHIWTLHSMHLRGN
jgi:hypothetical protein